MANALPPLVQLVLDASGTSETLPVPFVFTLANGDSLSATLPNMTQAGPSPGANQPPLTLGTPTLSGTTWTVPIGVINGTVNCQYQVYCNAKTTLGYDCIVQVNVLLVGSGYVAPSQPVLSPSPVNPNTVLAGPVSGSPAAPTFRALTVADMPAGVVQTVTLDTPSALFSGAVNFTTTAGAASGTLALASQSAATFLGGPVSGDDSAPVFRGIAASDLPAAINTSALFDLGGMGFNVFAAKYGVKGDGVTDDTAGLQASINDAIANGGASASGAFWFLPSPPVRYLITSSLIFAGPTSGTNNSCIYAQGTGDQRAAIQYKGPASTPAIIIQGLWYAKFYGITVWVGDSAANQVGFDFQFPNDEGIPFLHMEKCNVVLTVQRYEGLAKDR